MKKNFLLLSVMIIAAVYQNCCKVYCPRQAMDLTFVGFDSSELDTIIIRRFEPGGFDTPTLTHTIILVTSTMDTLPYFFIDADGFDVGKNYEVKLPGADRSYHIAEIRTRRVDCNCGQKDGKRVAGYTLDGQTYAAESVYLSK